MHEITLADAMCPKPCRVLGLDLLPYTIGHELLLWQRRNPFVHYSGASFDELPDEARAKALTQCVLLCCRKVPSGFKNWLWMRRTPKMDLAAETKKFREYREAGSSDLPTVKQPRVQGAPFHYFGGPEMGRLINYVSRRHGAMVATHFEGSPLNFPLGLARQLYLIEAESEGNVWIENWQDRQAKERAAAFERAHPEGTLAVGEDEVQKAAENWNKRFPNQPVPLMYPPKKKE